MTSSTRKRDKRGEDGISLCEHVYDYILSASEKCEKVKLKEKRKEMTSVSSTWKGSDIVTIYKSPRAYLLAIFHATWSSVCVLSEAIDSTENNHKEISIVQSERKLKK